MGTVRQCMTMLTYQGNKLFSSRFVPQTEKGVNICESQQKYLN